MQLSDFTNYFDKQLDRLDNEMSTLYYTYYDKNHEALISASISADATMKEAFEKVEGLVFKTYVGVKKDYPLFVKPVTNVDETEETDEEE